MKNLEKKKAWERWREVVEFERRMRIQLQGALKIMRRMKNLEKKKAWERWREVVEFERRMRIQLQGALKIMRRDEESPRRRRRGSDGWNSTRRLRRGKTPFVSRRWPSSSSASCTGLRLAFSLGGISSSSATKRFFRKQQALKRATAAGDTVIRQKRKTLVALAWRAWKYQMVDQDKLASVKQMLSKRLSAAKGTYRARWWAYVEHRRRKLEKFSVAVDLHRRWQKRAAFNQWIESVHAASTEMEAKLAKAMEWAFGASLSLTMSKWRALVKGEKQRKMAMQRMVGLLTGFGLENLGVHVLHAWREVCLEKQRGTAHLRKADNHRRARVLDQAFLSWKIQSMPLSDADHAKMLGQGADDVWDHDYDDKGDTTQVHAQVLVRRTRAMFDGLNFDSDEDTQDLIEEDRRATPGTGMRGVMSRAMKISQSGAGAAPKTATQSWALSDSDSDDDDTSCRRREGWGEDVLRAAGVKRGGAYCKIVRCEVHSTGGQVLFGVRRKGVDKKLTYPRRRRRARGAVMSTRARERVERSPSFTCSRRAPQGENRARLPRGPKEIYAGDPSSRSARSAARVSVRSTLSNGPNTRLAHFLTADWIRRATKRAAASTACLASAHRHRRRVCVERARGETRVVVASCWGRRAQAPANCLIPTSTDSAVASSPRNDDGRARARAPAAGGRDQAPAATVRGASQGEGGGRGGGGASLSLSLSFSHARPRASLHGSPRFPHLAPRND